MVPLKSWPGIGLVAVVTLALVAIGAVLSLGAFPAVVGILGWMLAVPALAILTYFDEDEDETLDADADPMETLRARYARGELTESEFERRLDRLLETEDVSSSRDRSTETERRERDPVRER